MVWMSSCWIRTMFWLNFREQFVVWFGFFSLLLLLLINYVGLPFTSSHKTSFFGIINHIHSILLFFSLSACIFSRDSDGASVLYGGSVLQLQPIDHKCCKFMGSWVETRSSQNSPSVQKDNSALCRFLPVGRGCQSNINHIQCHSMGSMRYANGQNQ
jgi:hypothetical protein